MDLYKDIIASINLKTENVFEKDVEGANKYYLPFIINKNFSFSEETLHLANEMNKYHFLDKKMQYDFYYNLLSKRKRFNKWVKQEDINNLDLVQEYYACSVKKAKEILSILTAEQIDILKQRLSKGEITKK